MALARDENASVLHGALVLAIQHPFQALGLLCASICLLTRLVTGAQFRMALAKRAAHPDTAFTVPVLPYWIPWLGHAFSFAFGGPTYLSQMTRKLGSNSTMFALHMANTKHHIVTVPSVARQVLVDRNSPVGMEKFVLRALEYGWNDRRATTEIDADRLWNDIHGCLYDMMRDNFLVPATKALVDRTQDRAWNLVSGSPSPVDQSLWERNAHVEVISAGDSDSELVAEASMFPLIRSFIGNIATEVLFGNHFLDNFPTVLDDLFEFDSQFNMFMAGLPSWTPGLRGPARARERVMDAVAAHHNAYFKYLNGQDPGSKWPDMSDVSSVIRDRTVEYRAATSNSRAWAAGDGALLWALNVNANPVTFWTLWYVNATPGLVEELRVEISPYVKLVQPTATGLPIKEAAKLSIDKPGVLSKCPLLKGAFLEAMRLEAIIMSYKQVEADFVLHESDDDARLQGRTHSQSFLVRKGEFICIPHGVHQADERYFRDPERFDPRRFWTKKSLEASEGPTDGNGQASPEIKIDYGTMKVWGGGKQICKGRAFAEREVLVFVAAIVMQWDMTPTSDGGKWIHPGRKVGAGTSTPIKDVRVQLRRRTGW